MVCVLYQIQVEIFIFALAEKGMRLRHITWFLLSREGNERKSILVSWYGQESTRE